MLLARSVILFAVFSRINLLASAAASTSTSSSPSYVSVRALDDYGHAPQLQNALKAANLQGTLVVAARDPINNSTIVLSLLEASSSRSSAVLSRSPPSMLQLTSNNPTFLGETSCSIRTAIVCTGLKTDANWLLSAVRRYSHRVWTRYNTFLEAPAVAHAVSKYFRMFWGYNEKEQWNPGELIHDFTRERESWARPLGVVAMILSSSLPYVFVIEPSGIVQRYSAFAMGKYSNEILEKLWETVHQGNEEEDVKDRLISLIRNVVPSAKKDTSILVETLSELGIDRTIVEP